MLALQLAWRFLREGRAQSILILGGVTVGIAAYVFVSAIIAGLQANLLDKTLGTQAHIVVESEEPPPRPLMEGDEVYARRLEPPEPRRRPFDQWQRALRRIEHSDGVTTACPKVVGAVLVQRGATQKASELLGAQPSRLNRIVDFSSNMQAGSHRVGSNEILIGDVLARELGAEIGSPLRVVGDGSETTLRVSGIFHLGVESIDGGRVVSSLRNAQTLLSRFGDITAIDVRVQDPFEADAIAQRIRERTGLETQSWMERNQELLVALRSQDSSTLMIRIFVLLAVAMGIASVLFVSVVQRRPQIGILRAVGASQGTVLAVFLWQGALLGLAGALLGSLLGAVFAELLESSALFEIDVSPRLLSTALVISLLTGVLAALLPARRAARMNPVDAIRGEG